MVNQKTIVERANSILFWITGSAFLGALGMAIFALIKGQSQTASNLAVVSVLMGLMNKGVRKQ